MSVLMMGNWSPGTCSLLRPRTMLIRKVNMIIYVMPEWKNNKCTCRHLDPSSVWLARVWRLVSQKKCSRKPFQYTISYARTKGRWRSQMQIERVRFTAIPLWIFTRPLPKMLYCFCFWCSGSAVSLCSLFDRLLVLFVCWSVCPW